MLDTLLQDIRHAVRFLARRPLVTGVAALSLALGIGVNTAIFSVFDRLLLSRLPVPAPEELVNLTSPGPHPGNTSTGSAGATPAVFTYPLFRDLERVQTAFTALGGFRDISGNVRYRGDTASTRGLLVSGGYFAALRLQPALGRLLTADDDREGTASDVVVLSHAYWTTRFGANPAVLNETLTINSVPMTIVGVAPRGFKGTATQDLERFFIPLRMAPRMSRWRDTTSRRDWYIYVLGRMRPGLTVAQAEAAMRPPFQALVRDVDLPAQGTRLNAQAREEYAKRTLVLSPGLRGHTNDQTETRTVLSLLFLVTGFVLLIACANVANLLLVRATERAGEVGVRVALGASTLRVLRLAFAEAGLLALLGGVGALVVARLTMAGVTRLLPVSDAELIEFSLNRAVLLFTAALSLATAIVFGLAPALHILRGANVRNAGAARSTDTRTTARTRALLAGGQVTLATALLALAGLLVASLANLTRADLGVNRTGLSVFRIVPVLNGYRPPQSMALFDQVSGALQQTPGVVAVSGATLRLLDDSSNGADMTVTGFSHGPTDDTHAFSTDVGERYFATLGIPLIAGREFTTADTADSRPVAIVNEAFARKFKLGRNAVGARIGTTEGRPPDIEIVGLVADAAYETAREAPPPQYFRPYRQMSPAQLTFYVRSAPGVDPAGVLAAIPAVVRRFDANLPVEALRTMDEQFDDSTTSERVVMTMSASLAALATLLAAIGLYAVLAYSISQRIREIGIRMALGARGADVRRMVLAQTSRIAVTACVIGVAIAIGLARVAEAMLYGVTPLDPRVQGGAALLMLAVAFCAGVLPARRAAAVDPVEALRAD